MFGCPGVPAQQGSNFVHGTTEAIAFMRSRRNPFHRLIARRRLRVPTAPGRRSKLAIIGHSLGAFAVSYVQGVDKRVSTAVALDKLTSTSQFSVPAPHPVVPSLGIQSEYGFTVGPYWMSGGSSLQPQPRSPDIPLALPLRPGPREVYVQAWLDRYLKRRKSADRRLRGRHRVRTDIIGVGCSR
jgi:hypothetical protein